MKYTENYKLLLPDEDDFFDVLNDNKNMDTLDTALKELKEDGANHASGQNNPHNVTAAQVGASNPNLLINWDFTKPVNQRGWTSGTANAYTIDRWFKVPTGNGIGTVTVNDGYITIGSENDTIGTWLVQRFESPLDRNSEYTISVLFSDGTIVTANTSTGNASQLCLAPIGNGGVIGLGETNMFITSGGGGGSGMTKVKAAKLEKGMVSTLKNDILGQSYGEELAACQRYCFALTGGYLSLRAAEYSANELVFYMPIPCTMRMITPTTDTSGFSVRTMDTSTVSGFEYELSLYSSHIRITATKAGHGLTDACLVIPPVSISNSVFDAEIY